MAAADCRPVGQGYICEDDVPAEPLPSTGSIAAVRSGTLYVYPSSGGGPLQPRTTMSSGWSGAQQAEIADWNTDGRQDLIAVWANGRLTAHDGQPSGGLGNATVIGKSGWSGFDIEVVKWRTGDRYPGILARNLASGKLYYYPNASGQKHGPRIQIGTGWKNLEIFTLDFDANGRMDLVARSSTGQLNLYRTDGRGAFLRETWRIIGARGWNAMTHLSSVEDHLGDGQPGIVARDGSGRMFHHPVADNRIGARTVSGSRGWTGYIPGS